MVTVDPTYRTRLCAITAVIFRAGEFKAAQIVIPEAKGRALQFVYLLWWAPQRQSGPDWIHDMNSSNGGACSFHSDLKEAGLSAC